MLVDANILLYAVDKQSRHHRRAARWLSERLSMPVRTGLAWTSLSAFLRIATHPRATVRPLTAAGAWELAREWLDRSNVWIPQPMDGHADVLRDLMERYDLTGNAVSDAHLAALAVEHGLAICSADTDFARFTEIRWENPLAGSAR